MKKIVYSVMAVVGLIAISCNNNNSSPAPASPSAPSNGATTSKSFSNVTFNSTNMYFSTSSNSNVTLDSNQAKLVASTIDITYTYDPGYSAPGFLDAITRSSHAYYWNGQTFLQANWANVSKQVIWYKTTYLSFSSTVFEDAKADQSKIGVLFSDTTKVYKTNGHGVWPNGTWYGGRNGTTGFAQYQIIGFKRVADGKRGLMKLVSIPSILNTQTVADIIIEN